MTTTALPRPPTTRPASNAPKLGRIPSGNINGMRVVINAVEGWGKTSTAAGAPNPAILMARGETGFETLRKAGRVPDCDSVLLTSWNQSLQMVDSLMSTDHQTIVFDAMGGFERLCHEHVCITQFENDWGEKGFIGYMRGYDVSVPVWLQLLQRLDNLIAARNCNIIFLSHAKAKNFKNPLGPDFDRYIADVHEKTWSVTHKWADVVLFGNYVTVTQEKKGRTKGIGGTERVVFTQRTDGYDAKNRFGMPQQIDMPNDPAQMWPTIWNHIAGEAAIVTPPPPEL